MIRQQTVLQVLVHGSEDTVLGPSQWPPWR